MIQVPSSIPEMSRAAVLRKFGEPLSIENVPVPQTLEPGAILVKTDCCTICGTDTHLVGGSLARKVDLPVIAGHEMTGHVVAKGQGTDTDSVGQPIDIGSRIVWTRTNCGHCYMCTTAAQPTLCENARAYMYESMEQSPYLLGGMSEYVYVLPQSGRVVVPENVDSALASMASCAFRSVIHAVDQLGGIGRGQSVVIQGSGPLGLLAIAYARIAGSGQIIVIGAPDARLALAKSFGADAVLSIEQTSAEERKSTVMDFTEGRGADIVMEFAGDPQAFLEGTELARRGGSYLIVGQLGPKEISFRPSTLVHRNLRLVGSLAGGANDYWSALQFLSKHRSEFPFERLLSNSYKLTDANDAISAMTSRSEIKPIVTF